MKRPISARIIKFPLKLIMVKTCNIFAAFVVIFLTSLSLSSAFINQDLDTSKHFQENLDLELQPFLREKREKDDLVKNDSLELEELSESEIVHDRRAIVKETQKLNHTDDEKNEEPETSNDAEEDVKDDMYKNMHDLIQAFILADEQDIAMRLQQLRELENATESEKLSNLPKRSASASAAAAAAAASNLLGANLWEPVPLADLDAHSCEAESVEYGHVHLSGLVVHEFFCEIRKLWHYGLIVVRNFRAALTLGPLIAEGVVEGTHGILSTLFHHTRRLLHTVIREPHHLLVLPDIIHDCVPYPSIFGAFHRFVRVVFKVIHHVRELFYGHFHRVFGHFFHLHHLGVHLRERLLGHRLHRLHHLYGGVVPYLEEEVDQFGGPVASAASAAATASASAAAAATATAAVDGGELLVPDYRTSLAEVLSSFRGIYDGYYASGIPHLLRTGVRNFSTTTTYSKVVSYLTNLPSCFGNVRSYITRIPSFLNYIRNYTPVEQGSTVTATASASSSVSSPVVGPAIVPIASVAPVETVSASASASASVAETPVVSAAPLYSAVPSIIPSSGASAAAAAAAVSAAAAASTVSASPIVSNAVPCTPVVESLSPRIVSETIENTVSESAAASSVAVSSPEVIAPSFAEDNSVATASASASASSASDVSPVISAAPFSLPYSLRYRSRPILSAARPASVASASSSASVSSGGNVIEPGQYGGLDYNLYNRYPLTRSRFFPAALPAAAPSSAVATAAASAASGGASAASAASTVSSGGLNFLLPRESIIAALGHDYLTPGDLISITLRNKAILIGRILDATSPVSFSFLRPKLRHSLLRHSGRVYNLSPFDFRDPECVRRLNSPLLLRYAI